MREQLPNRRRHLTDEITWPTDGQRYHISAGISNDARILEGWVSGPKVGSDSDHLHDDIAVLISRCLQHGDSLKAIADGIGRDASGAPASIVGAIVDKLAAIERSLAPKARPPKKELVLCSSKY